MPLHRRLRIQTFGMNEGAAASPYINIEIQRTIRRLTESGVDYRSSDKLEKRWAALLYKSIDGKGLKESRKTPNQHQWVTEGNRFLSGKDFINATKVRINALPTRSRTARGRVADRACRGGCGKAETLNHVLQVCHCTHRAREQRHQAITSYLKRGLPIKHERVEDEPHFNTSQGLRKPDLIAVKDNQALVIDAQVVGDQIDLDTAHTSKVEKYQPLENAIKDQYTVQHVLFATATLSTRPRTS